MDIYGVFVRGKRGGDTEDTVSKTVSKSFIPHHGGYTVGDPILDRKFPIFLFVPQTRVLILEHKISFTTCYLFVCFVDGLLHLIYFFYFTHYFLMVVSRSRQ